MKIWTGSDVSGSAIEVDQLATFTHYIKGRQFRFLVTRYAGEISVTHRLTGLRICAASASSSLSDWALAGKGAVDALIAEKGVDCVADVLGRAEKMGYGLLRGKSAK